MSKSNISVGTKGWADRINAAWHGSAASLIKAGQLLLQCKANVRHGEFTKMLKDELDFGEDRAQRLMVIARDERLSNPDNLRFLPSRLFTLQDLSALSDEELRTGIEEGAVNAKMRRADVKKLRTPKPKVTEAEYHEVRGSLCELPREAPLARGSTDSLGRDPQPDRMVP